MNSSATVTGCNDIIKRLRVAIAEHPLSPIHGYAADIAALLDRLDKAERENERLRSESKAQLEELGRIDDALGTNEGPSAVDHIVILKTENERLIAGLKEAVGMRVTLYRHSDCDGDTDRLTDRQVAERDEFARRWLATIDAARAAPCEQRGRHVALVCPQCSWTLEQREPLSEEQSDE